jgi:hypothetical protein
MRDDDAPVPVFTGSLAEATLVRSALDAEGIPCYLENETLGRLVSWYVAPGGVGAVRVLVAPADLERARDLVESAR